jgi:hypothetical protein
VLVLGFLFSLFSLLLFFVVSSCGKDSDEPVENSGLEGTITDNLSGDLFC